MVGTLVSLAASPRSGPKVQKLTSCGPSFQGGGTGDGPGPLGLMRACSSSFSKRIDLTSDNLATAARNEPTRVFASAPSATVPAGLRGRSGAANPAARLILVENSRRSTRERQSVPEPCEANVPHPWASVSLRSRDGAPAECLWSPSKMAAHRANVDAARPRSTVTYHGGGKGILKGFAKPDGREPRFRFRVDRSRPLRGKPPLGRVGPRWISGHLVGVNSNGDMDILQFQENTCLTWNKPAFSLLPASPVAAFGGGCTECLICNL